MPAKKIVLDKEEHELLTAFEKGELESVDDRENAVTKALKAAKATLKSRPVSLRIPIKDIESIQKRATEVGLPYQTLINMLIRQYVAGKIQLTI